LSKTVRKGGGEEKGKWRKEKFPDHQGPEGLGNHKTAGKKRGIDHLFFDVGEKKGKGGSSLWS